MGWAHVAAVAGVLALGSVAVAGNAEVLLLKVGTGGGIALLVSYVVLERGGSRALQPHEHSLVS